MTDKGNDVQRRSRYLGDENAENAVKAHNRAEVEQLIEDLEAISRNPQDIENGQREDLIHACAEVIASLTRL